MELLIMITALLCGGTAAENAVPDACAAVLHNPTATSSGRCVQVRMACGHVAELVDYLGFAGCAPWWIPRALVVVGFVAILVYLLLLMATTADRYFVPHLEVIADKLHMSPTVAGCTLLALGNGAPDVFTAFAALNDQSDVNMLVGGVLGASMFTSTTTLAAVIWCMWKKEDKNEARSVGLAVAASFMRSKGEVSLAESLTLVLVYAVYLILVILFNYYRVTVDYLPPRCESAANLLTPDEHTYSMIDTVDLGSTVALDAIGEVVGSQTEGPRPMAERFKRAWDTTRTKALGMRIGLRRKSTPGSSSMGEYMMYSDEFEGDISDAHRSNAPDNTPTASVNGYAIVADDEDPLDGDLGSGSQDETLAKPYLEPESKDALIGPYENPGLEPESNDALIESYEKPLCDEELGQATGPGREEGLKAWWPVRFAWALHGPAEDWPAQGTRVYTAWMAVFYLELPFTIVRGLSSPPAHMPMHGLVRLRTVLFPYGMVAVSMLAFGGPQSFAIRIGPIPVVVTAMLAAAIMSVVLAFLTRHNRAPSGVLELSLAALGFVSSIATISLISKEVVSLLTSLALMLGFSTSILSLTLLATGNSVGDAMANITLGRKGKFSMAVAAIFAGPIFHDLAGTAVAFAGACIQHHAMGGRWVVPVEVKGQTRLVFIFLITSVISSILVFCVSRFRPGRWYSFYLLGLYVTFVVMCVLEEANIIHA